MSLKSLRESARITQKVLAEKSGVSFRMVQKYENGEKDINKAEAMTVYKLSKALKCKMEDILLEGKMTVNEVLEKEYNDSIASYEIWKYTDKTRRLHTDFIKNIDEEYSRDILGGLQIESYHIMDEDEYNSTICANCDSADFEEWYDNKDAKVLVIVIDYDTEIE